MLFNLAVSLYTSRVIFQILGVSDLGIFQVVAGIITMFTFFNGGLAGATSRFMAFELGKQNFERLRHTFNAALQVHLIFLFVIVLLGETIGLWLVMHKLVIPEGRMGAAMFVYQCTILMTIIGMVQVPFNATIVAHEKMDVFAYIGILDTILKLVACFLLYTIGYDHLKMYGLLLLLFSAIIFLIYVVYCKIHYSECKFNLKWEKEYAIPIMVFSGWDVFGNFSFGLKAQAQSILLNMFFGVVLNAACGFSNTIYGAVTGFANNFMISVRPAITKAFSIEDYNRMKQLIIDSAKYSFCLMLLLSCPFFFQSDFILKLWLKTPPEYTDTLCKLQLLTFLIADIFLPIKFAVIATGQNKTISLLDGLSYILYLPLAYIMLRLFSNPLIPFIVTLIIEVLKSNYYTKLLKRALAAFNISEFYHKAVAPCVLVACGAFISCYGVDQFLEDGWVKLFAVLFADCLSIAIIIYCVLLSDNQRVVVSNKIMNKLFNKH